SPSHSPIYPLSLHDALPISRRPVAHSDHRRLAGTLRRKRPTRLFADARSEAAARRLPANGVAAYKARRARSRPRPPRPTKRLARSEEHTSELQSRFDLECRL